MFNLKFWNRTEKPPVPVQEGQSENDLEETEKSALEEEQFKKSQEKADPLAGLSLQEQAEALRKKRQEISALQERRREFYLQAKGLEDKMRVFGLSADKQKEIRQKIMAQGGEISTQIEEIRRDYGFEPTPVEVYSERLKMLLAEGERIQEEAALDYREAIEKVKEISSRLEKSLCTHKSVYDSLEYLEYIKKKRGRGGIEEIENFLNSGFDFNSSNQELLAKLKQLEEQLSKKAEESVYKTEGEVNEVKARYQRVMELAGMTELTLWDAQKKEGRFAPEK